MASIASRFTSCWSRIFSPAPRRPHLQCPLVPLQQARGAAIGGGAHSLNAQKYKRKDTATAAKKKNKARNTFINYDLKRAEQFSLCDAMRYIRAFEVGYPPSSPKYELHVKLRTLKNGPILRNRLRLPHPVKTDVRICVICPPDSPTAVAALKAGAAMAGDEEIFAAIKEGKIEFDRCICHVDSLQALNKAGVARILGPRGLMPSAKTGTVVKDVAIMVRDLVGGSEYKERLGVVRMSVGQLAFTPDQLQRNIRAFMEQLRKDMGLLSDRVSKEVHEVVLSSTHGPGFSLNGEFKSPSGVPPKDLSVA
ncbi:ribosomal protein L1 [Trichodelitschia bisporula]|uniref:Ribosomal protein L1 n=1 Tax=Trichodelitschia bisporula TaxID=703511 RepID=A0A6G1IAE7_9PEZI|nr:ribosomal protein L1 [Trichodelitschia bisporula]